MTGEFYDMDYCRTTGSSLTASCILSLRMLIIIGVNVFAFISGYYGVKIFSGGVKAVGYELLALSWGVIFVIVDMAYNGIIFRDILDMLLPTISGTCWYFSAYMYLLFLSPILNKGIRCASRKEMVIMLSFIILVDFCGGTIYHYNGTTFVQLLFVYFIGQYLHRYPILVLESSPLPIFLIACGTNMAAAFLLSYLQIGGAHLTRMLESNKNPLVLLSAISLFMMAKKPKNTRFARTVGHFAPYMFSVYIGHVLLLHLNLIEFKRYLIISPSISVIVWSLLLMLSFILADRIRILMLGKPISVLENRINSLISKVLNCL